VETFNEDYRMKEEGAILNWFDITEREGYFSLNTKMSEIMSTLRGKLWLGGMMLTMKKKMDANKKPAKNGEKKSGGFDIDMKSIKGMGQMLGGFTVLRLTSMMGMANISFNKEELLTMNAKLNKIKRPKEKK
jgi:beta-galactosidase